MNNDYLEYSVWKSATCYSLIFLSLFVAHIVAAANDWDLIFCIIAILITIQTMLVGFICYIIGKRFNEISYRLGFWTCIPLSLGLGWAYAGMKASWSLILWALFAVIIQLLTERGLKYNSRPESING